MQVENGKVIENTFEKGKPYKFRLGQDAVLKGMEEGVSTMHKGGRRKLFIPPDLGYGDRTVGDVPANSTLVVDVQLEDVK
jgi:FKBP-type peptidyl-prolyl cis-trans isomerase